MASSKPYTSVSKESSDVQMLDTGKPLVLAPTYASSSRIARVKNSTEPLVSTAPVQVLDSDDPLVLPCVSSVPDKPVAGPSGVAVGSSGSLPAIASSSGDEDEDIAPAMPSPTRSSGRNSYINSDEFRSMWNWRKVFGKLGTHEQCIEFAEERGLIPRQRMCSHHRTLMTFLKDCGQLGRFRCRKNNCKKKQVSRAYGTWFENARLPLTLIFQIMYAFSEGLTYHQTRKELACDQGPVVSTRTISDWFSCCRETIAIYELENQSTQGKIGGRNKVVQIDQSKFGKRFGRHIEGHWVIGMIENGSDDLRLEVCPDNESSADIFMSLIKKHVEEGSIINTGYWEPYLSLPQHGYSYSAVNHSDPINKLVSSDSTHPQCIDSQWRILKKRFHQKQSRQNFTDWLCEYSWRRRIMVNHLDAYEELLKAIKYLYK